jgi:hypothetical protein
MKLCREIDLTEKKCRNLREKEHIALKATIQHLPEIMIVVSGKPIQ